MIEKLTYTNERGDSVVFSTTSVYHVNISKDAPGLTNIQNSVFSSNSMEQDGDTFLDQRIISRDIDITGHINKTGKAEAAELRRKLIHVLNPHYAAVLTYELGEFKRVIDCRIHGKVDFPPAPVLQKFTIQLDCLNPFWREEKETRTDIVSWIGEFEFPDPDGFEINDYGDGMEFGRRSMDLIVNVPNKGDVETGLTAVLMATGSVKGPSLFDMGKQQYIKLNITMESGDTITISTGYGQKRALLRRGDEEIDVFRYLDEDSTFLQLVVGDNNLRYNAEENLENLDALIYHSNMYLGV